MKSLLFVLLTLGCLTAESQSSRPTFIVAMKGNDCWSCDLNLRDLKEGCLDSSNTLFVFPTEYASSRHWSRNMKRENRPHVFSDSILTWVKGSNESSIIAVLDPAGNIAKRHILKQVRCEDLVVVDQITPSSSIQLDSLDFNEYMVDQRSHVDYGDGIFIVNSGARELLLFNRNNDSVYACSTDLLKKDMKGLLKQLEFDSLAIHNNLIANEYEKLDEHPFTILESHVEGNRLRNLMKMIYVVKIDGGADSTRVYLGQFDFVWDIDIETNTWSVIPLPSEIRELGPGYWYTFSYAEFIHHDKVLLMNSTSHDVNEHGVLHVHSDSLEYEKLHLSVPDYFSKEANGYKISRPLRWSRMENGQVVFHFPEDTTLYFANGEAYTSIHADSAKYSFPADYTWLQNVFYWKGSIATLLHFPKIGSYLLHGDQLTRLTNQYLVLIGEDDQYFYFHKEPSSGVIYSLAK